MIINKKNYYSGYIQIGEKKFLLKTDGFNVRTLLDAKDYYLKNKRKHIKLMTNDSLHPVRLSLKQLEELIEETDRRLSVRDYFKE